MHMLSRRDFIKLFSAAFAPLDAVASVSRSTTPVDLNDPVSSYIKLMTTFLSDKFCYDTKIKYAAVKVGNALGTQADRHFSGSRILDAGIHLLKKADDLQTVFWRNKLEGYFNANKSIFSAEDIARLEKESKSGYGVEECYISAAKFQARVFCDRNNINFVEALKDRLSKFGNSLIITPTDDEAMLAVDSSEGAETSITLGKMLERSPATISGQARAKLANSFKEKLFDSLVNQDAFEDLTQSIYTTLINDYVAKVGSVLNLYNKVIIRSRDALSRIICDAEQDQTLVKNLEDGNVYELFGEVTTTPNRIDTQRQMLILNVAEVSARNLHTILSIIFAEEIKQGKVYISPPNDDSKRLFVDVAAGSDAYLLLSAKTNQIEANRSYF